MAVTVQTVTGPVESSQLGRTLIHEHLRTRSEEVAFQFPHLYDEEYEYRKAVEQLFAVKARGIATICDPTVMGIGRDIRFMERASRETGVQVVAATGVYSFHYLPTRFKTNSADFLADAFVRDIETGIQHTSIKAGFLKCATDVQGVTPDVEKTIRAVARAHLRTGVPIMTHSLPDNQSGLAQLDLFEEEGVDLSRVLIGHCGDTDNIEYIENVLQRGAFVGLDRYGITKKLSTERRNHTVTELVKRGYGAKMFLSQDYCCTTDMYKPDERKKEVNPDWSMTFLLDQVIPELLRLGLTEDDIRMMMIDNVRQWFEGV